MERRTGQERREEPRGGRRSDDQQAVGVRLSQRLDRAMRRRGLSIRALSSRSKVAQMTISRILKGENTSLDTLVALAASLNVPLDALIGEPRATS